MDAKNTHVSFNNWQTYQHYSGRNPPWIKLHSTFHETTAHLPSEARLLACLLFCVAANKGNRIPNDAHWISVEIAMPQREVERGLLSLLADGMLIPASTVASNVASGFASTDASTAASKDASDLASPRVRPRPRGETETDTEAERAKSLSKPAFAGSTEVVLVAVRSARQNDPVWDAVAEVFGPVSNEKERGRRNDAVKALRQSLADTLPFDYRAELR